MKIINLTFLKRTLLWGGLHFVVTLGALLASLESLGHFDDPNWEPSLISKIGETASNVLLFPAANIMSSWGGGIPDLLEWAVTIASSLLWGAAITGLLLCRRNLN